MRKRLFLLIVSLAATLPGCVHRVAVKPLSLSAYNHVESATLRGGAKVTETVRLKAVSGRIVEVPGDRSIVIKTTSGKEYELYPPFEVSFADGAIKIASGYRSPLTIYHTDIDEVLVEPANGPDRPLPF